MSYKLKRHINKSIKAGMWAALIDLSYLERVDGGRVRKDASVALFRKENFKVIEVEVDDYVGGENHLGTIHLLDTIIEDSKGIRYRTCSEFLEKVEFIAGCDPASGMDKKVITIAVITPLGIKIIN